MITVEKGDIFESGCEALVNPVNCTGVMGALAGVFRLRFPEACDMYIRTAKAGKIDVGQVITAVLTPPAGSTKFIMHFPTMIEPNSQSDIRHISIGMISLIQHCFDANIRSVAFPALGCGVGGLNFDEVKNVIVDFMSPYPEIRVKIYEPH
jgi:O-acetyl-ADP-ribose deacetylase (regulator of RNase III)